MVSLTKSPEKGGIAAKAGLLAGLGGGYAGLELFDSPDKPFLHHVLVQGLAGDRLKTAHQVIPAEINYLGQGRGAQVRAQMGVDIVQHLLDLRVLQDGTRGVPARGPELAVEKDQQLEKIGPGQHLMAEIPAVLGLL